MPSFDIVSEVDLHELSNAVDQANREITNRFDFKNSEAQVDYDKDIKLTIDAESEFQVQQIVDILHKKLAKRKVDITALSLGEVEVKNRRASLPITVQQGIDKDTAKKIVKIIKERKLKVQPSIQGEQVRLSGKKRDDLQQVMAMLREKDLGLPLQFINFRD
ncbi:MAG: YajQ family cyclic di-GMP-binding protein [Thiomargarita sp.]|nr:YajQ family cyclic di-GMP-binding protein [Thiomargarita sp.]